MAERRQFALDAAEHIVNMCRERDVTCELKYDASDCLSEGADVILEAFEKMLDEAVDEILVADGELSDGRAGRPPASALDAPGNKEG